MDLNIKGAYSAHIEFVNVRIIPAIVVELTSTLEKKSKSYIGWIDTGATHTLLSKVILDDMSLQEIGICPMANGPLGKGAELKTYRGLFKIVGTDNSEFEESIDVPVSTEEFNGYQILIGLDILEHAKFEYIGPTRKVQISFVI